MAGKGNGAAALAQLTGMAAELAGLMRAHLDALAQAPVVADAASADRAFKAIAAAARANLIIRQVADAEDKPAQEAARIASARAAQLEEMDMNDINADVLAERAADLKSRFDRVMALLEAKQARQPGTAELDRAFVPEPVELDRDRPRRAA